MGLTLKEMAFRYAKEENSRSEHRRDELADLGGALKNAIGRAESAREEQRAIQGLACAPGAGPGRVGWRRPLRYTSGCRTRGCS